MDKISWLYFRIVVRNEHSFSCLEALVQNLKGAIFTNGELKLETEG